MGFYALLHKAPPGRHASLKQLFLDGVRHKAVPAIRTVACRIATGIPTIARSKSTGTMSTIATTTFGVVSSFRNQSRVMRGCCYSERWNCELYENASR